MRKVKDIPNFPKELTEEDFLNIANPERSASMGDFSYAKNEADKIKAKMQGYNLARSEIGELEIPELDVEKLTRMFYDKICNDGVGFVLPHNVSEKDYCRKLAQAICSNQKELMKEIKGEHETLGALCPEYCECEDPEPVFARDDNKNGYMICQKCNKEIKSLKPRKKHPILYKLRLIYYSIYRFFMKIGDFFLYDIKAFIQRGIRGFAQRDTWGFDYYLAKVISEGIDDLIKEVHGHPCDLKNLKQWKSILRKISKTFKLTYTTEDYKRTKKQKKDYEEGWKLFKKYFRGLWD